MNSLLRISDIEQHQDRYAGNRFRHRSNPEQTVLRVRLKTSSRIAELSQHEADGGEFQEGKTAAVEIFPCRAGSLETTFTGPST
jgi:hypothetical protein